MTAIWPPSELDPVASDGSRSLEYHGGGPDQSPERNQAALIDGINACAAAGGGCVNLGVAPESDPLIFQPDPQLTMQEKVIVRGVPGATYIRGSEYATQPLMTITADRWRLLDVEATGGADIEDGVLSSILVINGAKGWAFRGSLAWPGNNGMVVRGPGVDGYRIEAHGCHDLGHPGQIGGGHVIALSGDGLPPDPFDTRFGYVEMSGYNILNGGVNVGSSWHVEVHARARNDYDHAVGPPDSGYALVRLANGSRRVWGTADGYGVGRVLRVGPCDEFSFVVFAEETSFEPVLLSGEPYTDNGWRGGRGRVEVRAVNVNMLAGEDVVRSKSHGPTRVKIDAYNRAGVTALRGMIATIDPNDPDLVEVVTKKVLHIRWGTFDDYVFPITANVADPTKIDWKAVRDDGSNSVDATVVGVTNTNDALAAAINALAGRFTANFVNGSGHAMELSAAGRKGSSSHRLRIGDVGSPLVANLNAGEVTSQMHVASGRAVADSPNGQSHFNFIGEIRDTGVIPRREVVMVTGRDNPVGNVFTVTRAQKGTEALAWDTTATFYAHPSQIIDEGGISSRMSLDSAFATAASSFCEFDQKAIKTDESNLRGVSNGVLFPPLGVRVVKVNTAGHIQWITGRHANRELIVMANVNGVILDHAATRADGDIKLAKATALTLNIGESVLVKCDENADQYREVGLSAR